MQRTGRAFVKYFFTSVIFSSPVSLSIVQQIAKFDGAAKLLYFLIIYTNLFVYAFSQKKASLLYYFFFKQTISRQIKKSYIIKK